MNKHERTERSRSQTNSLYNMNKYERIDRSRVLVMKIKSVFKKKKYK